MDRKRLNGGFHDRMDGYTSVTWHGAHDNGLGKDRDIFTSVYFAEDCEGGQFEIYFCSTNCLRAFFGSWVDALEAKIEKEKRAMKNLRKQ